MNNYFVLIGTIAESIKLLPVLLELEKRGLEYKIISTGQNKIADSDLITELKHKTIDYTLNTQPGHQTALSLFVWWIKTFFLGIRVFKNIHISNRYLIVHGDTLSTLMGSIMGKITGFKVTHIESGLRSFSLLSPFPEEIDRLLVSKLSDIHFAPNSWAMENLRNERGLKINTLNNTLIESLAIALKRKENINIKLPKNYFVFILHRQENLADTGFVKNIILKIIEQSKIIHCVFVTHGNTLQTLKTLGLLDRLKGERGITLLERIPYFSFMKILQGAEYLITDGGSNQEEAFYLGLPTYLLREHTERIEGLKKNVVLGGKSISDLDGFFSNYNKYKRTPVKIDKTPSSIIVDTLQNQK